MGFSPLRTSLPTLAVDVLLPRLPVAPTIARGILSA
jgi:hypothetical protein